MDKMDAVIMDKLGELSNNEQFSIYIGCGRWSAFGVLHYYERRFEPLLFLKG